MLVAWFGRYWPASEWTVLPRTQLIAKARQVAQHFGVDAEESKARTAAAVSNSLLHELQQHASDPQARSVSPLSLRITFKAKQDDRTALVGIDSTGQPLSWHAPEKYRPKRLFASEEEAASDAFRLFAGAQASAYGARTRSMGKDAFTEDYVWKLRPSAHSRLEQRIKVSTKDSVVQSAERSASFSSQSSSSDDDADSGDAPGYWNFLGAIFGLTCTAGLVVTLGIYVLWLVRRAVSHRFPVRVAGAALLVMVVALLAGSAGEKMRSNEDAGPAFEAFFTACAILCSVTVGRGISAGARRKWMSLEQLCLLAPMGRSTGYSIVAGVLFSPLLLAIPFLITGCGWFGGSSVLGRNADLFYSTAPLLDSFNVGADLSLLGFFGFGVPALQRTVRIRALFWLIVLPVGAVFFADETRVVTGPLAAPLIAGVCALLIYGFLYIYFDLLAVVTLQLAQALLLGSLILGTKGESNWSLVGALGCSLLLAYWFLWRGETVTEGDPAATIPALADFRAEREKLKAEFSLARRAQQDMLPQTPPTVAGFSLAASCTPSLEVGGDLYDFFKLPDGRIGIGVADVSGKGVPAALYMTLTKGLLASITRNNSELVSVVEEVNKHLHGVTRKKVFVTMALGFLDADGRVLECVRAGHNPVVWRQASLDRTTLVSPGGLGLGITASRVFSTQLKVATMALSIGDAVVFYSDGITEAMNSGLEQFGEERLMESVQKADNLDAAATRNCILGDVRDFLGGVHPQDDMTLVVLRVGAPEVEAALG